MSFKIFRPGSNKINIKPIGSKPVTFPSSNQNTGTGNVVLVPINNSTIVTKTGSWNTSPMGTWISGPSGNVTLPVIDLDVEPVDDRDGLNCKSCKEFYAYAEPNQPDNKTLICFSCRNGY